MTSDSRAIKAIPFIALTGALFLISAVVFFCESKEGGRQYVIFLFILPLLQNFFAIRDFDGDAVTHHILASVLVGSLCVNCALWLFYVLLPVKISGLDFLSNCAIVFTMILVGIVLYCTKIIMDYKKYDEKDLRRRIAAELSSHPFVALTSFLAMFLYVTFFLSFALAFHNRAQGGAALITDTPNSKALALRAGVLPQAVTKSKIWVLFFEEGKTDLKIDKLAESYGSMSDADFNNVGSSLNPGLFIGARNYRELKSIVAELGGDHDYKRARIRALGHASETPVRGSNYSSNFELSGARSQKVQSALIEQINNEPKQSERFNIEWDVRGIANDDFFLDPNANVPPGRGLNKKVAVEVDVEWLPGHLTQLEMSSLRDKHDLELLDYTYFMAYTITTTGYGDIKPASAKVKFMTTIANLYELLFIVVFFNALLSLGRTDASDLYDKLDKLLRQPFPSAPSKK